MKFTKTSVFAALTVAAALCVWTGCDDDHEHEDGDGHGHEDGPTSCKEITEACHHVDPGEGPINDCHNTAHAENATEESCAAVKANCLTICHAAEADAGESDAH